MGGSIWRAINERAASNRHSCRGILERAVARCVCNNYTVDSAMGRVFSNGPSKDFVINPFARLVAEATRVFIAAPYVTRTDDLIQAARLPNQWICWHAIRERRYQSRSASLILCSHEYRTIRVAGTASTISRQDLLNRRCGRNGWICINLTDGGLQSNREATILLDDSEGSGAIANSAISANCRVLQDRIE